MQIADNFTITTNKPLDDRFVVVDLTARDAIEELVRYEGMIVYVESSQTNFQLIGGIDNSNWQELSGSGSGGESSVETIKEFLVNDSANVLSDIGDYIVNCPGIIIEYYIRRKAGTTTLRMSGVIRMETLPDEAVSADRWTISETDRSEIGGDSGITFSLSEVDTNKSVLVVNLDNMAGSGHTCVFYAKITKFNNSTGKVIILDNNSINPITAIGEYLDDAGAILLDYYIYRRTDDGYKTLRGKLILEGNPDGATNPEKWEIRESERIEGPEDSGVSFSLDDVDTEKSILVITLDNMAGDDHRCDFYFNKTVLAN